MTLKTEPKVTSNPLPTPGQLVDHFHRVRSFTEELCEPLAIEDYIIQSMPDVSPTKWHIAHTSWFFETFILKEVFPNYQPINPTYAYLFNSYYVAAGQRHCRPKRGLLSRPTVKEVYEYRAYVNEHMLAFLDGLNEERLQKWASVVELGIHHEQQHQELMLTDLKHNFSINPLHPAYLKTPFPSNGSGKIPPLTWLTYEGGIKSIGHDGQGFSYDNEGPRHRTFIQPIQLASRLVTNGEMMEFMADGGYQRPELWLTMGWDAVKQQDWQSPLYWEKQGDEWWMMTLYGLQKVNPAEPACHISYYEADAYARWAGARLPTEAEWETIAADLPMTGNFVEKRAYHPLPLYEENSGTPQQMYGDVWEWTQSHYSPYPGYKAAPGALGEYNGKFMCNQFVLRGGSCATSNTHIRPTYRNFFHADSTWQFTGFRLAKDL